jgi:hypothetical protein
MRDVNSFYGIGLCEMLDKFQEEITAMHNQRIDAGTVSLAPTWAVKKDNTNIKLNEPVYVNKIWRLNDPKNDLVRMPLGDGAQSQPYSNLREQFAMRRSAAPELMTISRLMLALKLATVLLTLPSRCFSTPRSDSPKPFEKFIKHSMSPAPGLPNSISNTTSAASPSPPWVSVKDRW